MRIRRHAKISQLVLDAASSLKSGSALPQTYVCQLNQSPWDVMSFSPTKSPLSFQVNVADASSGYGDSDCRVSVGKGEVQNDGNTDAMAVADSRDVKKEQCCKTDGKRWRCRREAAHGSSLCHHHLSLVKNYQHLAHNSTAKKPATKSSAAETTRHSTRSSNKASSPPHSNEFYYYSDFRPGWSKRRVQPSKNEDFGQSGNFDQKHKVGLGTHSKIGNEEHGFDSKEAGYGKGEGNAGNGKKRVRKPMKARSLKSLM